MSECVHVGARALLWNHCHEPLPCPGDSALKAFLRRSLIIEALCSHLWSFYFFTWLKGLVWGPSPKGRLQQFIQSFHGCLPDTHTRPCGDENKSVFSPPVDLKCYLSDRHFLATLLQVGVPPPPYFSLTQHSFCFHHRTYNLSGLCFGRSHFIDCHPLGKDCLCLV